MRPNPSLKLTHYGRHCKPRLRYSVHCLSPGLQYLPPRAAWLERLASQAHVSPVIARFRQRSQPMRQTQIPFRRSILVLPILASFVACTPTPPNDAVLAELAALAPALLKQYQSSLIPADKWPLTIVRLKPRHVLANSTGLYIARSHFFVLESGLFVPRAPDFAPKEGTDPSYSPLTSGVFSYRISG